MNTRSLIPAVSGTGRRRGRSTAGDSRSTATGSGSADRPGVAGSPADASRVAGSLAVGSGAFHSETGWSVAEVGDRIRRCRGYYLSGHQRTTNGQMYW